MAVAMNMNYKQSRLAFTLRSAMQTHSTHNGENRDSKRSFKQLASRLSRAIIYHSRGVEAIARPCGTSVDNRDPHHSSDEEDIKDDRDQREERDAGCATRDETAHESIGHCDGADGN